MTLFDPEHGLPIALTIRIAVIAIALVSARRGGLSRQIAFLGSALASIVTALTGAHVLYAGSSVHGTLFVHAASRLSLTYAVDGLSAWFLLVLSTLAIPIAIFSIGYAGHPHYHVGRCSWLLRSTCCWAPWRWSSRQTTRSRSCLPRS